MKRINDLLIFKVFIQAQELGFPASLITCTFYSSTDPSGNVTFHGDYCPENKLTMGQLFETEAKITLEKLMEDTTGFCSACFDDLSWCDKDASIYDGSFNLNELSLVLSMILKVAKHPSASEINAFEDYEKVLEKLYFFENVEELFQISYTNIHYQIVFAWALELGIKPFSTKLVSELADNMGRFPDQALRYLLENGSSVAKIFDTHNAETLFKYAGLSQEAQKLRKVLIENLISSSECLVIKRAWFSKDKLYRGRDSLSMVEFTSRIIRQDLLLGFIERGASPDKTLTAIPVALKVELENCFNLSQYFYWVAPEMLPPAILESMQSLSKVITGPSPFRSDNNQELMMKLYRTAKALEQ